MAKHLQSQAGRTTISVKRYQAIGDFSNCDMLYIPENEDFNVDSILTRIGSAPILAISSVKQFILHGGMIGFVADDNNRVKMEANLKNIKANHVNVDAQILEIMQQVISQ